MESEAHPATEEDKAMLVKYVGWGAMPQVFDAFNPEWLKEREALRKELTSDEYESLAALRVKVPPRLNMHDHTKT